jgi:hypothetical protein
VREEGSIDQMKAAALILKGIQCDAPGCTYRDDDAVFSEEWLNKPCPLCGASLLTPEDLAFIKATQAAIDWANLIVGDLPERPRGVYGVTLDGSGVPVSIEEKAQV